MGHAVNNLVGFLLAKVEPMTKDRDILRFAEMVGAKEPEAGTELYTPFRKMFPTSNYFFLESKILIIKISHSTRPFWGVSKKYLDFLDGFDYCLVLLTSDTEGWVFSKKEIKANIAADRWRLREKDNNYKINMSLPDQNSFFSPERFLKRIEKHGI